MNEKEKKSIFLSENHLLKYSIRNYLDVFSKLIFTWSNNISFSFYYFTTLAKQFHYSQINILQFIKQLF